jgi:hypothetical protein
MLALAASHGVYTFALLFVPPWVALVQAAAFELTYIGLAVVQVEDAQRRRARLISIGAVVVSILYNTLSGFFHLAPTLLLDMHLVAQAGLAVLHGAPLAWLAFLVADLLLHQSGAAVAQDTEELARIGAALAHETERRATYADALAQSDALLAQAEQELAQARQDLARRVPSEAEQWLDYNGRRFTLAQLSEATGVAGSTLRRKLAQVGTASAAD